MGIFKRLKTMTMAEINGLLDGIEDPIAMLNEYSREMEQEIVNGQNALARQIFVEKNKKHLFLKRKSWWTSVPVKRNWPLNKAMMQWQN